MAVATLAFTLIACNSGTPTANPPPSPPPAGGTACPATITIGSGNTYSTSSCTIKVGAEVKISASGTHPLSGSGAGKTYVGQTTEQTISFATAGTFNFACDRHGPSMGGTITVEP